MNRYLCIAALLISVIALIVSIRSYRYADIALAKRERDFVASMTPAMTEISRDLLATNIPYAKQPETLEELIQPFISISKALGK